MARDGAACKLAGVMKRLLAHLLGHHPLATAALVVALAALFHFGWRFVDDSRRAYHAPEPDLALWMSPRYVAKSWGLPAEDVLRLMEIEPEDEREKISKTLADVIERTGLTLEELQRRVEIIDGERSRLTGDGREGDGRDGIAAGEGDGSGNGNDGNGNGNGGDGSVGDGTGR